MIDIVLVFGWAAAVCTRSRVGCRWCGMVLGLILVGAVFGLAVFGIGRVWIEVIGSTAGMLDGSCVVWVFGCSGFREGLMKQVVVGNCDWGGTRSASVCLLITAPRLGLV